MHDFAPQGEQRLRILAGIRSGGHPHVSAQAWGMSAEQFDQCMLVGTNAQAPETVRSFVRETQEAHAQARLRAEIAVFEDDPKVWLQHGPGRETPHRPGWAIAVKPCAESVADANFLHDAYLKSIHAIAAALQGPGAESAIAFLLETSRSKLFSTKESPNVSADGGSGIQERFAPRCGA